MSEYFYRKGMLVKNRSSCKLAQAQINKEKKFYVKKHINTFIFFNLVRWGELAMNSFKYKFINIYFLYIWGTLREFKLN